MSMILEIILTAGRKHQQFIENFEKRLKNFSINFWNEKKKKRKKKLNNFYDMKRTSLYGDGNGDVYVCVCDFCRKGTFISIYNALNSLELCI